MSKMMIIVDTIQVIIIIMTVVLNGWITRGISFEFIYSRNSVFPLKSILTNPPWDKEKCAMANRQVMR